MRILSIVLILLAFVSCQEDNTANSDLAVDEELSDFQEDTQVLDSSDSSDLTTALDSNLQDSSDAADLDSVNQEADSLAQDSISDQEEADTLEPGDEQLLRELIQGDRSPQEVIPYIHSATGLPFPTNNNTWIFIHWEAGSWALAGDFNDWTPAPMSQAAGFSWIEISISNPEGAKYKFTQEDTWIADPWGRHFSFDEYGRISFVRPPAGLPHLERFRNFQKNELAPRDLDIYIPPGDGPFPLLLAHDGQNLFDTNAIWGGWNLLSALEERSPMIVVGIYNTPDRMTEYTHVDDSLDGEHFTAQGDRYADLLQHHILPFVREKYDCSEKLGIIGSSLGGLISLYIAHLYPDEYDFAASLSGTLGWGKFELDNPLIVELYESAGKRNTTLYIDSGGGPPPGGCTDTDGDGYYDYDSEAHDNYCESDQFAQIMASIGYTWEVDLFHWYEPDALHNEAAWAARVHIPLEIFDSIAP